MYELKIIKKCTVDKTTDKMLLYTEKLGHSSDYYLGFGGVGFS
jgi:hypothetical protein